MVLVVCGLGGVVCLVVCVDCLFVVVVFELGFSYYYLYDCLLVLLVVVVG